MLHKNMEVSISPNGLRGIIGCINGDSSSYGGEVYQIQKVDGSWKQCKINVSTSAYNYLGYM